jgi:hypothetical protein
MEQRNMKKILVNSLSELPSEFDLAKYAGASRFGLADWTAAFSFRTLRRSALKTWRGSALQAQNDQNEAEMRLAIEYLWRNPLLPSDVAETYASTSMDKHLSDRQVRDQSTMEGLESMWEVGHDARMKRFADAMRITDAQVGVRDEAERDAASRLLWDTPMWKAQQESRIDDGCTVAAIVNLQAPEDLLVEDFRRWVREIKTARGLAVPRRAVSAADMKSWSDNQILPYLDLTFWADVNGFLITQQLLGDVLFPDGEMNRAERIRKTVQPISSRVATFDHCNYMVVQVLKLKAETGALGLLSAADRGCAVQSTNKIFPDLSQG